MSFLNVFFCYYFIYRKYKLILEKITLIWRSKLNNMILTKVRKLIFNNSRLFWEKIILYLKIMNWLQLRSNSTLILLISQFIIWNLCRLFKDLLMYQNPNWIVNWRKYLKSYIKTLIRMMIISIKRLKKEIITFFLKILLAFCNQNSLAWTIILKIS